MADVPDDEIAALLAEPLDRFVEARTARVKELKAAGEKDVAAALGKVRKPPVLVWAVGELARRHPDEAAEAAAVASELEDATAGGGGEIRSLMTRFRLVVGGLTHLADDVGVDASQVGLALRTVLSDPGSRQAWVEGRLLAMPDEGPFGGGDLGGLTAAPPKPAKKSAPPPKKQAAGRAKDAGRAGDDEAERREREAAERQVAERQAAEAKAEAERRRLAEAVDAAAEALDAAGERRREAATTVEEIETRLAELRSELDRARSTLEEVEAEVRSAEERLDEAEEALDQVR